MPRGDTQDRIYEFIKQTIELKGYPPSVREICDAVHLSSTSTVHGHLARLEKRGLIRRDPTKPRAIEVIEQTGARGKVVPVVGRVPAGQPALAVEDIEDYIMVPRELAEGGEFFALRVRGESMINAGILSGDYVIIRRQPEVVGFRNGRRHYVINRVQSDKYDQTHYNYVERAEQPVAGAFLIERAFSGRPRARFLCRIEHNFRLPP